MEAKFSLAHLTVLGCAPPEMIYIASMTGYDYVSIRPIYMGLPGEPNYDLANNEEMLRQTKEAMENTGIQVHDIELARIYDGVDLDSYRPAMKVGKELGAKYILSSIWTDDKEYYTKKMAELCDIAKEYDLKVAFEFVTWAGVKNLKEAKEVMKEIKRDNIGHMIDTLHFYRSRVELNELDDIPEDEYAFIHLCDGPPEIPTDKEGLIHTGRDARLYAGEGAININEIVDRMPKQVFSIELPHIERHEEYGYAEHARRCLTEAKEYLAKHTKECASVKLKEDEKCG